MRASKMAPRKGWMTKKVRIASRVKMAKKNTRPCRLLPSIK
jgi:hypothetical protein